MKKVFNTLFKLTFSFTLFLIASLPLSKTFAVEPISGWQNNSNLPSANASFPVVSNLNNNYMIGGSVLSGHSRVDVLSSSIDLITKNLSTWDNISTPLPKALIWHSSSIKGKYVYVLGGTEENIGSSLSEINTVFLGILNDSNIISSWQEVSPLPGARALGASAIIGNKIYYAGGFDSTQNNTKTIYSATIDPITGLLSSWTADGELPEPLSGLGMIAVNGKLVIIGGQKVTGYSNKVYTSLFNGSGGILGWQETSALSHSFYRGSVVINDNYLIAIGGADPNLLDTVSYAQIQSDGTLGAWTDSANHLPEGLCCGAAVSYDNYIYQIGGYGSLFGYTNKVYSTQFTPPSPPVTLTPTPTATLTATPTPIPTITPTPTTALIQLNVPLIKQNNPQWKDITYDTAALWSPNDRGIGSWGCALTSAVMILRFHGITRLPDNKSITPATLNAWLKDQEDGYVNEGWVNWLAISRLTYLAKASGNNPSFTADALEYSRVFEGVDILTQDLLQGNPSVLEEPGHFVVARGITESSFMINDPFTNKMLLSEYGNTYLSLNRFTPSMTDLSYLYVAGDKDTTITIKKDNQIVGNGFIQNPMINDAHSNKKNGDSFMSYLVQKPGNGTYKIIIDHPKKEFYTIQTYFYTAKGDVVPIDLKGFGGPNATDTYTITYDKQKKSKIKVHKENKPVTFQTLLDKIHWGDSKDYIRKSFAMKLSAEIIYIEWRYKLTNNKKFVHEKLEYLLGDVKDARKNIDKEFYKDFIEDIQRIIISFEH